MNVSRLVITLGLGEARGDAVMPGPTSAQQRELPHAWGWLWPAPQLLGWERGRLSHSPSVCFKSTTTYPWGKAMCECPSTAPEPRYLHPRSPSAAPSNCLSPAWFRKSWSALFYPFE